ncbi:MAG: carbamoyltransferase [Planctomycetes bacterium]|nr:carbamoyltransferase [Planctomycetota bacterium]
MTTILGLNAYHADAAAALLVDGRLVAAAEEERFSRIKHTAGFPAEAAAWCLREAGLAAVDLEHVAVSSRPIDHVRDEILYILSGRPAYSRQIKRRLEQVARHRDVRGELGRALGEAPGALPARLHELEHHACHMASAFYPSGFEEAAVCSIDGFGDFCSLMLGRGTATHIEVLDRVLFPHSLGILYTAFTQFLGFKKYGDEGKVMGMAAYGKPIYLEAIRRVARLGARELLRLDTDYFIHPVYGVDMVWEDRVPQMEDLFSERFIETFGVPRGRYDDLRKEHLDLAASLQAFLEEAVLHVLGLLHGRVGSSRLAYAGGVALNVRANSRIASETPFREVYIPPAATDAGTAVGAALVVHHQVLGAPRGARADLDGALLGPAYGAAEVEAALASAGLQGRRSEDVAAEVAALLDQGRVVGWFQGRMEFGPRALGARSILADPRRRDMKEVLNARVKYREPFRPFAASVLAERAPEWFEGAGASPYMLLTFPLHRERVEQVPAVVHADGSCRVQTVERDAAPLYHRLVAAFEGRTGVPLVLNTSFNENEPIVCSPADAIECFLSTKMDALALGETILVR